MSKIGRLVSTLLIILGCFVQLHAAALDRTFFTTYNLNPTHTRIDWTVCGRTPTTAGCYGSGSVGPFGKVGAMMEGNPIQNVTKGTVTRYIYVLDVASGQGANEVVLDIYKKVDTITPGDDTITVTLSKTVNLPLTGGSATVASMAANNKFLYVGTNQDELAVQMKKSNFAISQFSGVSGPLTVSSITADKYGFVTVTWGASSGPSGFFVVGPDGSGQSDGGGAPFMLNTVQGTLPAALP